LFDNIVAPFTVRAEIGLEKIREKKYSEYQEHDAELDKNDQPGFLTPP
jgi:hypothetical protein